MPFLIRFGSGKSVSLPTDILPGHSRFFACCDRPQFPWKGANVKEFAILNVDVLSSNCWMLGLSLVPPC